jgi:hypothetical protein
MAPAATSSASLFTAVNPVVITSSGRLFEAAARHFQIW